jgi:ATP-dependent Clp protease ATP-binding subunit ClpA
MMFERFTDRGRRIIILTREEAESHQNNQIGTEHLLLALLREEDGIAFAVINEMGLSITQIRQEIERDISERKTMNVYRVEKCLGSGLTLIHYFFSLR